MGLDQLRANLADDQPKGVEGASAYPVVFVAKPGEPRVLAAAECPEFADVILDRDRPRVRKTRNQHGLAFWALLGLCAGLLVLGFPRGVFLPALYAAGTGSTYLEASLTFHDLQRRPDLYLATMAHAQRHAHWQGLEGKKGFMQTYAMAGAWVLIGLIQAGLVLVGGTEAGFQPAALIKPLVPREPWRLLTGPMLHGSLMHLLMNGSAMLSLGPILERSASRHLVVAVWILGALVGSLFSWWLVPVSSVGASGGLMALLGFLAVMGWRRRSQLPPGFGRGLLRSIGIMALFGALAWQIIDNAAHGGGLCAGALIGLWVFRAPDGPLPIRESGGMRVLGIVAAAIFGVLTFATATLLWKG
ncbi:MAG TPA: rhomboid family intramembrane serine protease [Holophagaceae bacterium]|nr:rhomboid family intramembrane serine protease [Holophagaceae bacterium]